MLLKIFVLIYAFCGGILFTEGWLQDAPALIFIGCLACCAAFVLEVFLGDEDK